MQDKLLKMVFSTEKWTEAIHSGVAKDIDLSVLRRLTESETRLEMFHRMISGTLRFNYPHMAQIPKDTPGEFRTVIVSEPEARILDSIINNCLFELFPDMVHKRCKSYQKGIGTGNVALEVTEKIMAHKGNMLGVKYDFSKYFDTVAYEAITAKFDEIERRLGFEKGTEPVVNYMRMVWADNHVYDLEKNLTEQYMGIRQGNAIGSWLADSILYELDEYMSRKNEYYVRYSDDLIVFGYKADKITDDINNIICKYGVKLNPKKVEVLKKNKWFKFLGYSFKGDKRTLSRRRIKDFQKKIASLTVNKRSISYTKALNSVNRYLYKGDGKHAWATQVLRYVNSAEDLQAMDEYIKDCLRAVKTGKKKLYGLGYDTNRDNGVIPFATGKNVGENLAKCSVLDNYKSMLLMRNALLTSKDAYETLVREM